MKRFKYMAQYSGPSYFGHDRDCLNGIASISDAKRYFQDFYDGRVSFETYRLNREGVYVPWESGTSHTPATTREDRLWVYRAEWIGDSYDVSEDHAFVLSFGPRGGVVMEGC